MALPTPPAYTNAIPNNPFYSVESYLVQGAYSPYIVGSGLSISPTGVISATGGGGGGAVTGVFAGTGITVSANTGSVVVTNAGVTSLVAGPGISLSGSTGSITVCANATGTVTAVTAGAGLSGGTISTSGTIAIANTGVTAATYTNPTLIVNSRGQITGATNGTAISFVSGTSPISVSTVAGAATVAINAASTTQAGAVQLSNSLNSTSVTQAATSNALKTAFDTAVAAIPKACLTGKGALVTATAAGIPTSLPIGGNGQVLTACSSCPRGMYWGPGGGGGGGGASPATPTAEGTVFGCTDAANYNYGLGDNIFGALTTGQYNIAIGTGALNSTDSGTSNTAVGIGALFGNTTGIQNVAVGQQALFTVTTEGLNTAVGSQALQNTTGGANTALGNYAGNTLTTGCSNILIGNQAGGAGAGALDTGNNNIVIGNCVSVANNAGDCQLVVGVNTVCWLTGNSSGAIKPGAGIIDCSNSCGSANQVLASNGSNALCWRTISAATPTSLGLTYACVDGPSFPVMSKDNASLGYDALGVNVTTGALNTAVGNSAASQLTSGCYNTSVGYSTSFWLSTGCYNTALGSLAMFSLDASTESCNTAVGYGALTNTGGSGNVALGYSAGCQAGCSNVGGDNNSFIGNQAGCNLTSGSQNVVIGCGVQAASPTGSCQLAIGFSSTSNWLTGDSTKAIKPGAGIIDCAGVCGSAGQALLSTGNNGVVWGTPGIPGWTDAGAMTIGATVTAPPPGNVGTNKIYYRQLGNKEYEVIYIYRQGAPAGNNGSGDYLFTLPAGLQFDTTLPFQPAISFAGPNPSWPTFALTGPSVSRYVNSTGDAGIVQPLVYSATQFRVIGAGGTPIGSSFFPLSPGFGTYINFHFQFTST